MSAADVYVCFLSYQNETLDFVDSRLYKEGARRWMIETTSSEVGDGLASQADKLPARAEAICESYVGSYPGYTSADTYFRNAHQKPPPCHVVMLDEEKHLICSSQGSKALKMSWPGRRRPRSIGRERRPSLFSYARCLRTCIDRDVEM